MGEMVEFASNGAAGRGYLAPATEGAGLGVVVIQEWWGLVDHIVDVCDRFSSEGFTALAPDLYHGRSVPNREPDQAARAEMELDLERAAGDLSGAVDFLKVLAAVRGHGAVHLPMPASLNSNQSERESSRRSGRMLKRP